MSLGMEKLRVVKCDPFEVGYGVLLVSDGLQPSVTMQCDDFVAMLPTGDNPH